MGNFEMVFSSRFKKDFKKYQNRKKEREAVINVFELLANGGSDNIPETMKPHLLRGEYNGFWECHIMPDLLIIWDEKIEPSKEIYLARVGTHSELFK